MSEQDLQSVPAEAETKVCVQTVNVFGHPLPRACNYPETAAWHVVESDWDYSGCDDARGRAHCLHHVFLPAAPPSTPEPTPDRQAQGYCWCGSQLDAFDVCESGGREHYHPFAGNPVEPPATTAVPEHSQCHPVGVFGICHFCQPVDSSECRLCDEAAEDSAPAVREQSGEDESFDCLIGALQEIAREERSPIGAPSLRGTIVGAAIDELIRLRALMSEEGLAQLAVRLADSKPADSRFEKLRILQEHFRGES